MSHAGCAEALPSAKPDCGEGCGGEGWGGEDEAAGGEEGCGEAAWLEKPKPGSGMDAANEKVFARLAAEHRAALAKEHKAAVAKN